VIFYHLNAGGHRKGTLNTEFLLKSKEYNFNVRIECKWQQVSGSVDGKLPYLYLNSIEAMPESNIIIIIRLFQFNSKPTLTGRFESHI